MAILQERETSHPTKDGYSSAGINRYSPGSALASYTEVTVRVHRRALVSDVSHFKQNAVELWLNRVHRRALVSDVSHDGPQHLGLYRADRAEVWNRDRDVHKYCSGLLVRPRNDLPISVLLRPPIVQLDKPWSANKRHFDESFLE